MVKQTCLKKKVRGQDMERDFKCVKKSLSSETAYRLLIFSSFKVKYFIKPYSCFVTGHKINPIPGLCQVLIYYIRFFTPANNIRLQIVDRVTLIKLAKVIFLFFIAVLQANNRKWKEEQRLFCQIYLVFIAIKTNF